MTSYSWTVEQTPQAARLAEIRRYAERVHPDAVAQCLPAMLRDLQAEADRLVAAARVQRAEDLCEVAALLGAVGHPQAAELVNAQVLLEWVGNGHVPMRRDIHTHLLVQLAEFQTRTGASLVTDGANTSLVVDAEFDRTLAGSQLDRIFADLRATDWS